MLRNDAYVMRLWWLVELTTSTALAVVGTDRRGRRLVRYLTGRTHPNHPHITAEPDAVLAVGDHLFGLLEVAHPPPTDNLPDAVAWLAERVAATTEEGSLTCGK